MPISQLRLVVIAYASFVILGLFDGLLGVAWPSMRAAFGQPVDALGLLLAMAMTGHITASFINGKLITGIGLARLLVYSAGLLSLGALLQLAAFAWLLILSGGLLVGMGMGLLDAGMNTYAASHFRPRLLNWLHASFGLGTSLGALLMTGYLSIGGDWRWGIATLVLGYVLLFVAFLTTRKAWQYRPENVSHTHYAPSRQTLRLPLVWLSIALFFLYTGLEAGIGFWTFTMLTEGRGMGEGTAGLLTTLYWSSFLVGRIVFGFIESGLTRLIRFCLIAAGLGVLLLTLSEAIFLTLVGLVIIGFSIAPIFPGWVALTPGRVGHRHAPNAIGYQIGAAGLAGAALPGLAGVLGDAYGLQIMPWFFLTIVILIILLHEWLVRISAKVPQEAHGSVLS